LPERLFFFQGWSLNRESLFHLIEQFVELSYLSVQVFDCYFLWRCLDLSLFTAALLDGDDGCLDLRFFFLRHLFILFRFFGLRDLARFKLRVLRSDFFFLRLFGNHLCVHNHYLLLWFGFLDDVQTDFLLFDSWLLDFGVKRVFFDGAALAFAQFQLSL